MMSNKKSKKRPYTQRARARRREELHRRITKAAVQLHGSVGPARTTVRDIAKLAGVRRATVYNHFSSDSELYDACSSLWFSENPPPDPTGWAEISDPAERIKVALEAMYEYYGRGREMLGNVLRDTPQVPSLREVLRLKWWPLMEMMVATLAEGWSDLESDKGTQVETSSQQPVESHDGNLRLNASLRVALDFFTWQTMSKSGLSAHQAARLAAAWIGAGVKSIR
jgi:AcrR family transcriptional regulator